MKTDILKLTPTRIRRAIKREGANITWLANQCNVSRSTMHRYIDKPGSMPVSVWAHMVQCLNLQRGEDETREN